MLALPLLAIRPALLARVPPAVRRAAHISLARGKDEGQQEGGEIDDVVAAVLVRSIA
jgi:hypothetical protein